MPPPSDAHVFTIAPGEDFAAALAHGLLTRVGDPVRFAEATIYLPTRRAAATFAESFSKAAGGAALLPDFKPLGDVDEDEAAFDAVSDELAALPAMAPHRRLFLLATLVRRWALNRGDPMRFAAAAALAESLAALFDECERQNADIAKLADLAPESLAAHWAEVKDFLVQANELWPGILAAEKCGNPEARRKAAIAGLTARLAASPPSGFVIAAGSTGSMPAVADLMKTIARLPHGAVVLPGLDRNLDEESWNRLDPGHPQYGLKQLLQRMEVGREDVLDWIGETPSSPRHVLWRETLRPAPTTDAWRTLAEHGAEELAAGFDGLALIEAADPAEEANVVALILREALETPGRTAALITRDRNLARRTAAALTRWDIVIDDSAGRPLAHAGAGSFLCLLAAAADADFAPVPLLALLKHPLATMDDADRFRRMARKLDLHLRGPRPDAGLTGIDRHIEEDSELSAWFAEVAAVLAPFAAAMAKPEAPLAELIKAHAAAAEALAGETLWKGDDGAAANLLIRNMSDAADVPDIDTRSYAPLFSDLAMKVAVRPAYRSHPRLAILGPLEARLQSFDLTVLGGLNEGVWPAAAAGDPWFSRPMRRELGLEQPERAIGLSAHDFAGFAASPAVVLTRSLKSAGSPATASRWLQRLEQLSKGLNLYHRLRPQTDYQAIAAEIDAAGTPNPIKPPAPRPPVKARPRRLSVTEIETWLRDPYAIYAKHVLGLRPLDALDAEIGPLERGSILHAALERFVKTFPHQLPADAAIKLIAIAEELFAASGTPKAVLALWRPRFARAAFWFVGEEGKRRENIADSLVEIAGKTIFKGPAGDFTLTGRADRIDRLKSGGGAILDYKTGSLPRKEWLVKFLAPQLALEGAMLAAGGFENLEALEPSELIYARITGGRVPGEIMPVPGEAKILAKEVTERLIRRIAQFDREETPYPSRVAPKFAKADGDYDHLARVREWSASGWQEDE